jgi:hypothetical protein
MTRRTARPQHRLQPALGKLCANWWQFGCKCEFGGGVGGDDGGGELRVVGGSGGGDGDDGVCQS